MSEKMNDHGHLSSTASAFLEARGLDPEVCERLGVISAKGRSGDELIVFPYERKEVRVNRKFRKIAEKAWGQDSGGEQIFWRRDVLTMPGLESEPLVICEGEFDVCAAAQAGFWRSVSVPGGAPKEAMGEDSRSSRKYAFLEEARADLEPIQEIIIAADGDAPGVALLSDLTALLGPARCKFVSYPEGCKDLNDVLLQGGVEAVRQCLAGAKWTKVAGVYRLSDLPPLPPLKVWRPKLMDAIDRLIPICPGHLSIWTGIAGHGKSTLLNAVAWTIAEQYGMRIAHGSFETTPQREYLEDAIAFRTGKALDDREQSPSAVSAAREWVGEHIVFINSDGYALGERGATWIDGTVEWFIEAATTAVVRSGCRVVILDPWSQIDHERANHEREDEYIRRALKRLKVFARTFDIHVAVVAHPVKPKRDALGNYMMPEGYEISGASHFYNFADLGVTVHRSPPMIEDGEDNWVPDPRSTRVLIRAWKVKFHRSMNKPGDAFAQVDFRNGRYMPAEHCEARSIGGRGR